MTREQMIKALAKGYAPSWQRRLEQMPDHQIAAVYNRKLAANQLK